MSRDKGALLRLSRLWLTTALVAASPALLHAQTGGEAATEEQATENTEAQPPAAGAAATDGSVLLDPILLSGRRLGFGAQGDAVYATAAPVSSTDAQDLQTRSSGNPQTALRSMPGTFTRQSSSQPGIEVNIRGMSGYGRVNAMIDGVPQTFRNIAGHEGSGGSLLYIQPELLAGVDVVRGSVAGAEGSGTLSGAANFRSIDTDDVLREGRDAGVMARLKFGDNGYNKSGMLAFAQRWHGLWGGEGEINYVIGTAYTGQGNYDTGEGEPVTTSRASVNSPKGSLAKLEVVANSNHKFSLGVRDYRNTFSNSSYRWDVENRTWTVGYDYTPGSQWVNLDVDFFYNDTTLDYIGGSGSYVGRSTEDRTWGVSATNRAMTSLNGHALALEYGLSWSRTDFQTHARQGGNFPGNLDKASLFSDAVLDLGRFSLNGGLRYDYWKLNGYRPPYSGGQAGCPTGTTCGNEWVSRDGGKLLPRLGVTWKATDEVELYATYSHTYRPPTVQEAFFSLIPTGTGVGSGVANNLDLDPEYSRGVDLGMNFRKDGLFRDGDKARLKIGLFHNSIKDFIVNDFVYVDGRGSTAMWVNRDGTTRMKGIEIEGSYDAGFVYASLSYTNSKTDQPIGDGAGWGNGEASILPDEMATLDLGLRLFDEKLTFGSQIRYVGKGKEATGLGTWAETDGYTLVDLYGSYAVNEQLDLFFSVENLEDKTYGYAGSGYSGFTAMTGRGRTLVAGVTARF